MYALTDKQIADVMFGWSIDNEHAFEEQVAYTGYLTWIRDRLIWQYLDAMCGFDVITALEIAEMQ